LIGYELNSSSQISRLETGINSGDTDRLIQGAEVTGMYQNGNWSLNWDLFFDKETIVWIIPEDKENESEYSVADYTYFTHLVSYTVTPYNLDDYTMAPHVVVEEGAGSFDKIKATSTMYVYLDTYLQMDENGEEVRAISCVGGTNGTVEYLVSESCTIPTLTKGDCIKIKVNSKNMITNIDRCYSIANLGTEVVPSNGYYTTELMAGTVKRVDYSKQLFVIECGGDQTLRNDIYASGTTFIINRNDARGTIETCGFNDIEIGDYVVLRAQHSRLYDVYIVKNI